MSRITDLKVKIFADGADYDGIVKMAKNPVIKGFTTNPTLMRKAGVNDYEAFARKVLAAIPDRPVSFEVFADDFASMAEQARAIAAWAPNVNVKIPVTNTKGQSSSELLRSLSSEGVPMRSTRRRRRLFRFSPDVLLTPVSIRSRTCWPASRSSARAPRRNCCGQARGNS